MKALLKDKFGVVEVYASTIVGSEHKAWVDAKGLAYGIVGVPNPLYELEVVEDDILEQVKNATQHLTLAELSRRTGISLSNLSRYFSGAMPLKAEAIEKIVRAVGKRIEIV